MAVSRKLGPRPSVDPKVRPTVRPGAVLLAATRLRFPDGGARRPATPRHGRHADKQSDQQELFHIILCCCCFTSLREHRPASAGTFLLNRSCGLFATASHAAQVRLRVAPLSTAPATPRPRHRVLLSFLRRVVTAAASLLAGSRCCSGPAVLSLAMSDFHLLFISAITRAKSPWRCPWQWQ